jgi:hypothetical protein
MYTYIYIYIHIYIHIHVYIYIYIYKYTETSMSALQYMGGRVPADEVAGHFKSVWSDKQLSALLVNNTELKNAVITPETTGVTADSTVVNPQLQKDICSPTSPLPTCSSTPQTPSAALGSITCGKKGDIGEEKSGIEAILWYSESNNESASTPPAMSAHVMLTYKDSLLLIGGELTPARNGIAIRTSGMFSFFLMNVLSF